MGKNENIKLINQLFTEVLNRNNPNKINDIIAIDYHEIDLLEGQSQGRSGVQERLNILFSAFPDAIYNITELVADENKVAVKWTMNATHSGRFMGVEPTNKSIKLIGMDIYYIEEGLIVSHTNVVDMLGLLTQLKETIN